MSICSSKMKNSSISQKIEKKQRRFHFFKKKMLAIDITKSGTSSPTTLPRYKCKQGVVLKDATRISYPRYTTATISRRGLADGDREDDPIPAYSSLRIMLHPSGKVLKEGEDYMLKPVHLNCKHRKDEGGRPVMDIFFKLFQGSGRHGEAFVVSASWEQEGQPGAAAAAVTAPFVALSRLTEQKKKPVATPTKKTKKKKRKRTPSPEEEEGKGAEQAQSPKRITLESLASDVREMKAAINDIRNMLHGLAGMPVMPLDLCFGQGF